MNNQTHAFAAAVCGLAVALAFILGTAKLGVVIAIVAALVLSIVYRFGRSAAPTAGGRNRNRNRG